LVQVTQEPQPIEVKEQAALSQGKQETQPAQDDESIAEEIRVYLERGYSFKQLTEVFHFKDSAVRQEMVKLVPLSPFCGLFLQPSKAWLGGAHRQGRGIPVSGPLSARATENIFPPDQSGQGSGRRCLVKPTFHPLW